MLALDDVIAFVEEQAASGVTDMAEIEAAAFERFKDEADAEGAIRRLIKQRVSLAVVRIADEEGERLAFSVKDAEGKRTLAHMGHNTDPKLWLQVSAAHAEKAKEHQKISNRAYSHAVQLRLAFMEVG